jgi:hypothetical protein
VDYQRLYEYRFRAVSQARRDDVWAAVAPMLYERMNRPQRILDPAAGRCEFINAVPSPERWAVDAVAYEEGARREGTRLIVSDIMKADLPREYFGGVFVSNFLEHLSSQEAVSEFLERMYECVIPSGRIAIMGPNFRFCSREYFDYADHTVVLTERGVEEHLYAAGFTIISVYPKFLPYTFSGRLPSHPALVRAYLQFPLAWRILGKQFLVIAERTAEAPISGASADRAVSQADPAGMTAAPR